MYKIIVSFVLILVSLCSAAQKVTNIRAQQEGRNIVIYYDLSDKANVSLDVYFSGKRQKTSLLSGDIGRRVEPGDSNKIVWHVLDERRSSIFFRQNVVFTVRANAPYRTFLLAEGGASALPLTHSAGLMIGGVGRIGWYLKGLSNYYFWEPEPTGFIIPNNDEVIIHTSIGDKVIPFEAMPYNLTGKQYTAHWVANAGMVVRCYHQKYVDLYLYFGAGYGERKQVLQTVHDGYLVYQPSYHRNVGGDIGLLFSCKNFVLSVGATSIGYKYVDTQIGLGFIL